MTPLEKTPGEYEELLREAKPEELAQAVLHAEAIRLQAAHAAETTQDLQRELRQRAEAALLQGHEQEGEPLLEEEAPAAGTELQSIVTYALLTKQAEELRAASEPDAASPESIIDRIRGAIERATAETPRITT